MDRTTWLPVSRKYKRRRVSEEAEEKQKEKQKQIAKQRDSSERTSICTRPTSDVTPTARDL